VEEVGSKCDFDESKTPVREVPVALAPLALAIGERIRAISDDELRQRPAPAVPASALSVRLRCATAAPRSRVANRQVFRSIVY
jgi:hypothetical protein